MLSQTTLGGPFIGTVVLSAVFAVMWRTYRERYLGWWLLACLLWLARYAYAFALGSMSMPPGSIVLPLLAVGRGYFILLGGFSLVGRPLPRAWAIVFAADLGLLGIEAISGATPILGMESLTHYGLYSAALISAGIQFIVRPADRGPEAWFVSFGLVTMGLLQLSFPFTTVLGTSLWSATPLAASLLFATPILMNASILCAGIGIMMHYFRKELRRREELVRELSSALDRALQGYLPICAHCKSIRDAAGEWHRFERYISDRTEAAFTHGICPSCADENFPAAEAAASAPSA